MKKLLATFTLLVLCLIPQPTDAAFKTYRYGVIANVAAARVASVTCIEADDCVQTSLSTMRESCFGALLVIKYDHQTIGNPGPPSLVALGVAWVSHQAILVIMETPAWSCPGPPDPP